MALTVRMVAEGVKIVPRASQVAKQAILAPDVIRWNRRPGLPHFQVQSLKQVRCSYSFVVLNRVTYLPPRPKCYPLSSCCLTHMDTRVKVEASWLNAGLSSITSGQLSIAFWINSLTRLASSSSLIAS